MRIYDFRRNPRRSAVIRRIVDRRTCLHPYGSPEWIENIKIHYLAWPNSNRRDLDRRSKQRRASDRRQQQLSEQQRSEKKYSPTLLTQAEIKLIEDLYLCDMD